MNATFILLPGFDGKGTLYRGLMQEIGSEHKFIVIQYSNNQNLSEYIEEALSQIPPAQPCVLIAESFSGPIALQIACRGERDVRGVVLSATFLVPPMKPAIELGLKMPIIPKAIKRQAAQSFCLNGVSNVDVVDQVNRVVADMPKRTIKSRLRALLEMDATSVASQCEVPVLYLQARDDRLVSDSRSDELVSALNNCQRQTIAAPHLLFQAKPAAAADSIRQWMGELPESSAPDA